ncbi:MAG: ion transporter [Solirubrobacteraceae bacterium]|nr:ion transporter [Solirubrobacteraceae bacterium]
MTPEQAAKARKWEMPATIVSLLIVPYLLLAFYATSGIADTISEVLYLAIWIFFLVEMIAMLRIAPDNWAWARRNVLDISILVAASPVTLAYGDEGVEVLQVLWLLRILDLMPVIHRHLFRITVIRFAFILWALVIFGGGLAYAKLEAGQDPAPNLLEAIYWANTTVSTVGYGDWLPHTTETILLAMPLQAMGVVLGAILVAGILPMFDKEFAEGFSDKVARQVERIAGDVADIETDIDEIAKGERSQDRVLAQIARDLVAIRTHVGLTDQHEPRNTAAAPRAPADEA